MMPLRLPMLTVVLSTGSPTQLLHEMLHDSRTLSIVAKMLSAVADEVPHVRLIFVDTWQRLVSKTLIVIGFIIFIIGTIDCQREWLFSHL